MFGLTSPVTLGSVLWVRFRTPYARMKIHNQPISPRRGPALRQEFLVPRIRVGVVGSGSEMQPSVKGFDTVDKTITHVHRVSLHDIALGHAHHQVQKMSHPRHAFQNTKSCK